MWLYPAQWCVCICKFRCLEKRTYILYSPFNIIENILHIQYTYTRNRNTYILHYVLYNIHSTSPACTRAIPFYGGVLNPSQATFPSLHYICFCVCLMVLPRARVRVSFVYLLGCKRRLLYLFNIYKTKIVWMRRFLPPICTMLLRGTHNLCPLSAGRFIKQYV